MRNSSAYASVLLMIAHGLRMCECKCLSEMSVEVQWFYECPYMAILNKTLFIRMHRMHRMQKGVEVPVV